MKRIVDLRSGDLLSSTDGGEAGHAESEYGEERLETVIWNGWWSPGLIDAI
jgi:hypothetical protein